MNIINLYIKYSNGIILYADMKKIKENLDKDMFIKNFILSIKSSDKYKENDIDNCMEIVCDDKNEVDQEAINKYRNGLNRKCYEIKNYKNYFYSNNDEEYSVDKYLYIDENLKEFSDSGYVPSNDEMYLD